MIGDSDDALDRIKSTIPRGWFAFAAPIRDALLGGLADQLSWLYSFIGTARLQTRIATATGFFVDLIGYDFFGLSLQRRKGELDTPYSIRIRREVLRERVTRAGMTQALIDLTGQGPIIIEPWSTQDCAAIGYTFAAGDGFPVGSLQYPSQVFIQAFRPGTAGVQNIAGIYTVGGGIGVGALTPIALTDETGVTDADIYQMVTNTKPTGTLAWIGFPETTDFVGSDIGNFFDGYAYDYQFFGLGFEQSPPDGSLVDYPAEPF